MDVMSHFPADKEPRPEQTKLITEAAEALEKHDVVVIQGPTGVGKTEVAYTLANWNKHQTTIASPDNINLQQLIERYPMASLHRKDSYQCGDSGRDCASIYKSCKGHCKGCVYLAAKREVKNAHVRAMNYYTYWAHRLYSHTVLFDEAHKLTDMMQDKRDVKLWRSQYKFPSDLKTVADVIRWGQDYLREQHDERLHRAVLEIIKIRDSAAVEYKKTTRRDEPDTLLHVTSSSARNVPPWLWPDKHVKRLILMSATIGPKDIHELGLDCKRVAYVSCGSPIPPENRPVVVEPCMNMARRYASHALPVLATKIEELLKKHPNEKGLVHLPYNQARELKKYLKHPRVLFHSQQNKNKKLAEFTSSSDKVLVASGLYEGVDLPYDAARWQVLGKTPYLSLGDERIRHKTDEDPDWYAWETIKRVMQATGRIVRAEDDYGITYCFDSNFRRLFLEDQERPEPMFPSYFSDAIQIISQ